MKPDSSQSPTPSEVARSRPQFVDHIQHSVEDFLHSLEEGIHDLSALEVNTMVVSEITGLKFNPYIAYKLLYELPTNESAQICVGLLTKHTVKTQRRSKY